MGLIGILLIIVGLVSFIPVVPIAWIAHLHATIKGIGRFSGPAGFVLILVGAILHSYGI